MKNYAGDRPLVSIVMAAHNGDIKYLPRCLASIQAQTIADDIELIVAFDGTPDEEAVAIMNDNPSKLPKQHPGVGVIWDPEGKKTGYYTLPRNRALPHCRAPYIANIDIDNEWRPAHLEGLVTAIREMSSSRGWPHFAYSRRDYVKDPECEDPEDKLPTGPSNYVPWNAETVMALNSSPNANFVDTSDFLMSKGAYYELGLRTGYPWNPDQRRFGDWELMCRVSRCGFWGVAVDQVTHIYHWTGKNLQTNRWLSDITIVPESVYNKLVAEGLIDLEKEDAPSA
jgi:hypothetical protein